SVAFLTLWAFVGLETGTVPAGQVFNASKIVPRATILGTMIAAVVYILGTVVVMGVVSPHELLHSKAPYADAAQVVFGGNWAIPVSIAAIISCLGTLNGWTMIVGRIPYGAAQDGLFPSIFTRTTTHGTPYWGIIISSVCALPLLTMSLQSTLLEQFNFIVDVAVTLILLVYTVSVLAYLRFLIRDQDFSVGRILLGFSALAFALWALWAASIKMVFLSLMILLCGVPMHLWMKWPKLSQRAI
ncbi:MAG TPA: amino acid permease, partial [Candidatus Nitrosotenuis sp.]|nr:amino acid permease [Candidatus Nitrosotenuis sp.]